LAERGDHRAPPVHRNAPEFWWRPAPAGAALALWPAARLWGAAVAWRMAQPPRYRPPVAVVCVGNLLVGGAGRTPTVIALARMARGRGLKPGILVSGHDGRARGPILVDPTIYNADHVGDEAMLAAAVAPTVVARDRAAGAKVLAGAGVDLIVMDGGLHDPALPKDLALIAVDAGLGIGNGLTVPSGPMRAPLQPQLRRADALLVVGEGEAAGPLIRAAARAGRAVIRAELRPTRVREWRKQPILAFAGIARPQRFFAALTDVGATLARTMTFPDGHRYTAVDAETLMATADADGLRLVTSEQDMARLAGRSGALALLAGRTEALAMTVEFENAAAVAGMIDEAMRKAALAVPA
jgi:tetraacyldisaccharide 4'-kinase